MDDTRALDLIDDAPPGVHGYGVHLISLSLRLVTEAGVSLRAVPRVLKCVTEAFGCPLDIPDWTTIRLWLMRWGHSELTRPVSQAEDWVYLMDHSVQIGRQKVLAIVGLRLCDLPQPGQCLRHHDLRLISLIPRESWTRPDVDQALEQAIARTGVPRAIVNDHGVDIHGGVRLFQERHSRTVEIYDIKHKAACLLKQRLEKEPRWQAFQAKLGATRCAVQQTDCAFATPPAPKPKARFMNLQPQLDWAERVLKLLRNPPPRVLAWTTPERLQEKLGWLHEFAAPLAEWSQWQRVVDTAVKHVNQHGIYRGVGSALRKEIRMAMPASLHAGSAELATDLVKFVVEQARRARAGERLPGSTEVLESCFGKMKQWEKQQSRGGFTSLVVSFGAMLNEATTKVVKSAMQQSKVQNVLAWCKNNLGTTLFSQRTQAFAGATEPG